MKLIPTRNAEPIRESDRIDPTEMWGQCLFSSLAIHVYDHLKFKAQSRYAKAKSYAEARQYLSLILYIEHRALRELSITV